MTALAARGREGGTWPAWPGYLLLFSMLFVPTSYQLIKGLLLALVLMIVATDALERRRLRLDPVVLLLTLLITATGCFFMLRGYLREGPGALRVGTVYVLWPLVYAVLAAGAASRRVLEGTLKVLAVAGILVPLYIASFVLHKVNAIPSWLYIPLDQGQNVGFYQGYVELAIFSLSSLLFLVPFFVAALLVWPRGGGFPVRRIWLWAGAVLGFVIVLISGRRALFLVVAISPFVALTLRRIAGGPIRAEARHVSLRMWVGAAVALVAVALVLNLVGAFTLESVWVMLVRGFHFVRDINAQVRRSQFYALLGGWAGDPLLGAGHGMSALGSIRAEEMPWAYELSYLALLFHVGLLGFSVYLAGIVWIAVMGIQIVREGGEIGRRLFPVLVGSACFLIASGTNPYLEKFDYLWVVFLPVAFINAWLIARPEARSP